MSYSLTDEDIDVLINDSLKNYSDQLTVRLNPETQKEEIEKIINKETLRKALYWYGSGFRDAIKLVLKRVGKDKELEEKELELFKNIAKKHPELLENIKKDFV